MIPVLALCAMLASTELHLPSIAPPGKRDISRYAMSHGYDRLAAYEAGANSSRNNHMVDMCLLDSPGAERIVSDT